MIKLAIQLWVCGLALGHGVAYAQTGVAPNPSDIWNTVLTSGPLAAVLAFGLYRVDHERRQLQSERDALLERVLNGLNAGNVSLQNISVALDKINASFAAATSVWQGERDRG